VAALDLDEAAHLDDVREVLDGLAARLAARNADPAALRRLGKSLARMRQCVRRRDANQWFPAHVAFHDEIFRASGNPRLQALGSLVRRSIRPFHPLLLSTRHRLAEALAEHRAIYHAIAVHDGDAAERLARAHIVNAKEIVLKVMTQGDRNGAVQA
jgi:DNA-binding GntR family transcriptional regulator